MSNLKIPELQQRLMEPVKNEKAREKCEKETEPCRAEVVGKVPNGDDE
jgi:hypothetical protein